MKLQGIPVFFYLFLAAVTSVFADDDKIDTEAILILRSDVKALDQTVFDKKPPLPADMNDHVKDLYLLVGLRNNNPYRVWGSIKCVFYGTEIPIKVGYLPPKMDHWSYYLMWVGDIGFVENKKDSSVKVQLDMRNAENMSLFHLW